MLTAEQMNKRNAGSLPGLIGVEILEVDRGIIKSQLKVCPKVLAPNGYLHAATAVALADTSCGWGTVMNLPKGAQGFTTIELKSNFLGTVHKGFIECEAKLAHEGHTTQVWDAQVSSAENSRTIALFRCTQMILYPLEPSHIG
jgi:1,4-dihydroxy-2-naphthoyl-CoA hydrolase